MLLLTICVLLIGQMAPPRSKIDSLELLNDLKARVATAAVITPDSPGYEESIKRWSDAAVKQAVHSHHSLLLLYLLNKIR